ncbi:MAG: hypothetical protein R3D26_11260 [Cyanobacteriota/Melainabacteria group bacterium]
MGAPYIDRCFWWSHTGGQLQNPDLGWLSQAAGATAAAGPGPAGAEPQAPDRLQEQEVVLVHPGTLISCRSREVVLVPQAPDQPQGQGGAAAPQAP